MFSEKLLPNQLPDEKTLYLLRRHWFILLKIILFYAILFILPFIVELILNSGVEFTATKLVAYPEHPFLYALTVIISSIYYLSICLFFYHAFLDYYLDVFVVTTERIISIEQNGIFSRTIAEQRLFRIQDVTSEVKGIFPTFLNYGNLFIQTAGTKQRFTFQEISDPAKMAEKINKLVEYSKVKHPKET